MSLPTTLSSLEDAIALAELALGPDSLVAVVDGPTRFVMPIAGDVPAEGVVRLDALLLETVGEVPDQRLILATRRGGPPLVTEAELDRWWTMLDRHRGHALPLVDWLVFVDGGAVLSLAEVAGPAWDQSLAPPDTAPAEMAVRSSTPPTAMRPAR